MEIEDGRAWALDTFGVDGVRVREQIPAILRDCHEKLANAQMEAEMKHAGVYGQIWRKAPDEFFAVLGKLPSADIVRVRGYKLVAFNGTILFPWRFARESTTNIESRPFATSGGRISLFAQDVERLVQPRLDIEFEHPELTEAELQHLSAEREALRETLSSYANVVVVAYASNPSALHSIDWGKATLGEDGYLTFEATESLLAVGSGALTDVDPVAEESFSDGPIPRPQLGVKEEGTNG